MLQKCKGTGSTNCNHGQAQDLSIWNTLAITCCHSLYKSYSTL